MSRLVVTLILIALMVAGVARPGAAAPIAKPAEAGPRLEFWTGVAPLLGLDRILRGGRADLGLGFRDSAFLPSASLNLTWDRGLGVWMAEGLLSLGLGPGLAFHGGLLYPLADAGLNEGGGRTLKLEPAANPGVFGFDAELGSIEIGPPGLRLSAFACFDYQAWRIDTARRNGLATPLRREDALAVFSAGIMAGLGIRLGWAPWAMRKRSPRSAKRRFRTGFSSISSA